MLIAKQQPVKIVSFSLASGPACKSLEVHRAGHVTRHIATQPHFAFDWKLFFTAFGRWGWQNLKF